MAFVRRAHTVAPLRRLWAFIRNRMLGAGRFFVVGEDIILPSWGARYSFAGRFVNRPYGDVGCLFISRRGVGGGR